jgi:hypothetical protein
MNVLQIFAERADPAKKKDKDHLSLTKKVITDSSFKTAE